MEGHGHTTDMMLKLFNVFGMRQIREIIDPILGLDGEVISEARQFLVERIDFEIAYSLHMMRLFDRTPEAFGSVELPMVSGFL
jgi:hypothetical protein